MIVERKPNGDYLAQAEPSDTAPEQRETLLVLLLWALGDSDCSFLGEEYCLGNALGMAADVYDYYSGKVIRLPYSQVDKLAEGKPITFYARDPEYDVGDWVSVAGSCEPYEIVSKTENGFLLRSEYGELKAATMDEIAPYMD